MTALEERLHDLCNVRYMTLDSPDEIQEFCCVEMCYCNDWIVWLTDECGSGHTAEAYCLKDGELQEGELIVGMGYDPFYGECRNVFGDTASTLEEALSKLEKKVAILRENPDCVLLFSWDD